MRFATPLALLGLLVLPGLGLLWRRGRGRGLLFSDLGLLLPTEAVSWRLRLRRLPVYLRLLALILLIVALARPQAGIEKVRDVSRGVAIEMVVDRSGSMGNEMNFEGRKSSRLEVVKQVFAEFVNGNRRELKGRPADLIGMVSFDRYPETVCPLTLAHGVLAGFIKTIRVAAQDSPNNRTAIGDAIALAAARLHTAEQTLARQVGEGGKTYTIKSKIIILLTDGQNNAGRYAPEEAAQLAKKWGIKIYAIGVGGDGVVKVDTLFGTQLVRTGEGVDRQTLEQIAKITGGSFWMAQDGQALRAVYREIDHLEKSEVESVRYLDYREYFVPLAAAALILLLLEAVLRCTLFRRLP
ncbi:MAG: VWA domain-containing protein [Desulfobacteraceae bacterium]|nr:VWA domain-containing protein [Desulfobacteraceae bacterium]